jgi:hypothetical protein
VFRGGAHLLSAASLFLATSLLLGCGAPLPSISFAPSSAVASRAPASPHTTPRATPSQTPSSATLLTHFSEDGLSFDYPAEWPVIAEREFSGVNWVPIVVGTGEWSNGCESSGSGTVCTGSEFALDPGEVILELSSQIMGPAEAVFDVPSFGARLVDGGLAVDVAEVLNGARAAVHVPGRRGFVLNLKFGGPVTDSDRAIIDGVIGSLEFAGAVSQGSLRNWAPGSMGSGGCSRAEIQGRIGRGDLGFNLIDADLAWTQIVWPPGWVARLTDSKRVEVLDNNLVAVAREWDEVALGGRGERNEFRVCPEAVTVVRAFPTTPD